MRTRGKLWSVLAAGAVALTGCAGGAGTTETAAAESPPTSTAESRPPLDAAKGKCAPAADSVDVGDDGNSLMVDMPGEGEAGLSMDTLLCLLTEIDVPDHVISQMEKTRALDGMQSAEWDGFTATWTYHPDNGLDVIFTHAPD